VSIQRDTATFKFHFCPSGVVVEDAKIVRDIECNLTELSTFGDLSRVFRNSGKFPRGIEFSFFHMTSGRADNALMITVTDGTSIIVHYPPPGDPATQRFIWKSRSGQSTELRISRDETVRDVKRRLLSEIGLHECLPGLVSLTFYACDLCHADKFCDYGIPENSWIDVTDIFDDRQTIQVGWGSASTAFNFTLLDSVADVELALRRMKGDRCRDFALFRESTRLASDFRLIDLDRFEVEVIELLRFESPNQAVEVPLRADATVGAAREALAIHLCVESSRLQLVSGDCPITDLSLSIWGIGDPIQFCISRGTQTFFFEDRRIELTVDFALPLRDIEPAACRGFNIPPPITFFLNKAELDRDTALIDFELSAEDVIEVKTSIAPPAVSACPSLAISLLLGIVPRKSAYELPPTATIADAETRMRQRYELGDLELDFYVWDAATDDQELIPKSTVIGNLDMGGRTLIARPATSLAAVPPAASELELEPEVKAPGAETEQRTALEVLHVTCGSVAQTNPGYAFSRDDPPDQFTLYLPPGAKVGDARARVGERYTKPPEAITFQFMGKTLRDAFVMDRLRLGTAKINVHVQDDSAVVLLTAKANRMGR
jgi:hypothetical protein